MGWKLARSRYFINMTRLWNRFLLLDGNRLIKHIFGTSVKKPIKTGVMTLVMFALTLDTLMSSQILVVL